MLAPGPGVADAEWLAGQRDATVSDLCDDPDLPLAVRDAVDRANTAVSRAESIRRFHILGAGFTAGAELTRVPKGRQGLHAGLNCAAHVDALCA